MSEAYMRNSKYNLKNNNSFLFADLQSAVKKKRELLIDNLDDFEAPVTRKRIKNTLYDSNIYTSGGDLDSDPKNKVTKRKRAETGNF